MQVAAPKVQAGTERPADIAGYNVMLNGSTKQTY